MGLFVQAAYKAPLYQIYYAALLVGSGSVILVYALLRSKLGLGLMAMRDDEQAAQSAGVEAFRYKLYCFLIAAFVTGLAASVLYMHQIFIQPYKAFSIDWTVRLLFIVIIGGIGTIEGPIIGALIFVILQQVFSEWLNVGLLLMGGVCIGVMLVAPRGIAGLIHERLGFEVFPLRRE
jgi:branched-chain amino acid transport system permease protein